MRIEHRGLDHCQVGQVLIETIGVHMFDLINLKAELERSHDLQSTEMLILGKAIANLRRRFN